MLEKMDLFFEVRLSDYDAHMLRDIEGAREFYPYTAGMLPQMPEATILDLGCGTGLELEFYFAINPRAKVTGIDLSEGMLRELARKFPDKELRLIQGSYFDTELGENRYDGAVSVESLHHFTLDQKVSLYKKIYHALKPGGWLILTDYLAPSEAEEIFYRQELARLKKESGIRDDDFYHYDTPLTPEHECQALAAGGFRKIEKLRSWGATWCIKAQKE